MNEKTIKPNPFLTDPEIKQLRIAIDVASAATKRAINTAKKPEFRAFYERDLEVYKSLHRKLDDLA